MSFTTNRASDTINEAEYEFTFTVGNNDIVAQVVGPRHPYFTRISELASYVDSFPELRATDLWGICRRDSVYHVMVQAGVSYMYLCLFAMEEFEGDGHTEMYRYISRVEFGLFVEYYCTHRNHERVPAREEKVDWINTGF